MGCFVARFTETVISALPAVEDGTIRGAKLIGLNSRNGRRYEGKALQDAIKLYEGRKVYVDHPKREHAGGDRSFHDWAGVIENVAFRKGEGLFGDVVLRQSSPYFAGIVEAATNPKFRSSCGFSHVADGASRLDGETEIIESITEVFSVDLVTDPATTAGIFESVKPAAVTAILESLPEGTTRTLLVEAHKLYEMFDAYGDVADEKADDPQSQMLAAIVRALDKVLETVADLAGKITASNEKQLPALPEPPAELPAEEEEAPEMMADEQAPTGEEPNPELDQMKRENAELKAKTLLLESNRDATPARIKALASAAADDQADLLESWPAAEGDRPTRSPALNESFIPEFPRDDPAKFAALLR